MIRQSDGDLVAQRCDGTAINSATHVVVLSHDPGDVLVFAVPVMLADPAKPLH